MIANKEVLAIIAQNPWTALVLSPEVQVIEAVPFAGEPSSGAFLEFARSCARGRPFRLLQQADLSEAQLNAIISQMRQSPGGSVTDGSRPTRTIEAFQSSLNPFAPVRVIAEAIAKWFAR